MHRRLGGSTREMVSCRAVCAYVCARGVLGQVGFQPKRPLLTFPFPFCGAGLSLFLCATICSLFPCDQYFCLISMIPMISMIQSESK